jgi:fructuronate reductase
MGADAPPRLSRGALPRLAPALRPRVDTGGLRTGIVHLGLGAFHRAHQAVYTEDALAAEAGDWGICGVGQRNRDTIDRLRPQDGLYSVLSREPGADRLRVIGVLRDLLLATEEPDRLRDLLAAPATHVVSITVTEKGYRHDPASGRLRDDDPELAADLAGRDPHTMIGRLVRGLRARMTGHGTPLTVLSCDNLPGNGALVESLVADYCARLPPRDSGPLAAWIGEHVRFPSSVVDRIVPASTDGDRADAARILGMADHAAVAAEPYRQWVIEDRFAGPRPAWHRAGALFVDDVRPHQTMKLRLLNGAHSALAYLGAVRGYGTVSEAVADPAIARSVELVMTELLPTLPDVPGVRPHEYAEDIRRRFADPAIAHSLEQIAEDGSQKLRQRLLEPARELGADGTTPRWICLAVAGWIRYLRGDTDDGRPLAVRDPLAERLRETVSRAAGPVATVDGLLHTGSVFPPELADSAEFRDTTAYWLDRLVRDGIATTVAGLADPGP